MVEVKRGINPCPDPPEKLELLFMFTSKKNSKDEQKANPERNWFCDIHFLPILIFKLMKEFTTNRNVWLSFMAFDCCQGKAIFKIDLTIGK